MQFHKNLVKTGHIYLRHMCVCYLPMEAAEDEADAEDCCDVVVEATAASYSLWTLFKTFMAFTCRLSTYSGSVIVGGTGTVC